MISSNDEFIEFQKQYEYVRDHGTDIEKMTFHPTLAAGFKEFLGSKALKQTQDILHHKYIALGSDEEHFKKIIAYLPESMDFTITHINDQALVTVIDAIRILTYFNLNQHWWHSAIVPMVYQSFEDQYIKTEEWQQWLWLYMCWVFNKQGVNLVVWYNYAHLVHSSMMFNNISTFDIQLDYSVLNFNSIIASVCGIPYMWITDQSFILDEKTQKIVENLMIGWVYQKKDMTIIFDKNQEPIKIVSTWTVQSLDDIKKFNETIGWSADIGFRVYNNKAQYISINNHTQNL